MRTNRPPKTGHRTARFCIWTLRHQSYIARQVRLFTWSGTLLILFLALAGQINLDVALQAIIFSLASIALLLGLLISARRNCLLHIRDPELREIAHMAMLNVICRRRLTPREKKLLVAKFGRRHCEMGHC
jgi:hypothetical protein